MRSLQKTGTRACSLSNQDGTKSYENTTSGSGMIKKVSCYFYPAFCLFFFSSSFLAHSFSRYIASSFFYLSILSLGTVNRYYLRILRRFFESLLTSLATCFLICNTLFGGLSKIAFYVFVFALCYRCLLILFMFCLFSFLSRSRRCFLLHATIVFLFCPTPQNPNSLTLKYCSFLSRIPFFSKDKKDNDPSCIGMEQRRYVRFAFFYYGRDWW